MTCKDCFHYNACNKFAVNLGLPTTDEVGTNKFCGCYKSAADVVPKSEVERLEKLLDDKCDRCIERERAKVAREIFDDIERLMFATKIGTLHGFYYSTDLKTCVAELKKKYTESEGKE